MQLFEFTFILSINEKTIFITLFFVIKYYIENIGSVLFLTDHKILYPPIKYHLRTNLYSQISSCFNFPAWYYAREFG